MVLGMCVRHATISCQCVFVLIVVLIYIVLMRLCFKEKRPNLSLYFLMYLFSRILLIPDLISLYTITCV